VWLCSDRLNLRFNSVEGVDPLYRFRICKGVYKALGLPTRWLPDPGSCDLMV
jgi:hypothetical protein